MVGEISNDPEIVRDNIRRLSDLSERVATVVSRLRSEELPTVPSALEPFNDALAQIVEKTLAMSQQLEKQIRAYSRDLGATAQKMDALDQDVADLLNRVEQSAFEATATPASSAPAATNGAPTVSSSTYR